MTATPSSWANIDSEAQLGNKPNQCEALLINQDIEARYKKIRSGLEISFNQGQPQQLHNNLVKVQKKLDDLALNNLDQEFPSRQEVTHSLNLLLVQIEQLISIVPQLSDLAPQVRDRYIMPFTTINNMRAEYQNCLMQLTVESAKNEVAHEPSGESSSNIYSRLVRELDKLNNNLYYLQMSNVQKFVGIRAELIQIINKLTETPTNETNRVAGQKIPTTIHTLQAEIEKLLPGLQLSKQYYSLIE